MQELSRELCSAWEGATVILSPRDIEPDTIEKFAKSVLKAGGRVLLDPQFYLPKGDHDRLTSHEYWPEKYDSGAFWSGADLTSLIAQLADLNSELGTGAVLLPGLFAHEVDDDWLGRQLETCQRARKVVGDSAILFATVALSADALKDEDQVHAVLEAAEEWGVRGAYLVCEHPKNEYFVAEPVWLSNVLDLCAGLRLHGLEVLLGYSNQQMLIASCACVSAIASGTWMNVRSFPPEKFKAPVDDETKRKTPWYYCPQALSEFTVQYLDLAKRQKILGEMAPDSSLKSEHASILFEGAQPSTVGFGEKLAFRHYLQCLRIQVGRSVRRTYGRTLDHARRTLDEADALLQKLRAKGITGQGRDFTPCLDATRSALTVLDNIRGAVLNRRWEELV